MKPKTIAGAALLAFAGLSVVVLIVKEATRPGGTQGPVPGRTRETGAGRIVVYYFRGNARCSTCRTIEAYACEAVEAGFPDLIRDGALAWRTVNVDEPGNEHFVKDFQLASRSVVVAEVEGDRTARWKNLPLIWDLAGDKADFLEYIQVEVRDYTGGD